MFYMPFFVSLPELELSYSGILKYRKLMSKRKCFKRKQTDGTARERTSVNLPIVALPSYLSLGDPTQRAHISIGFEVLTALLGNGSVKIPLSLLGNG
jgi:hypothetical protein